MNESQTELETGLGTQEPTRSSLKPAKVKIVSITIEPTTKAKKVAFVVKHPDKEETIKLSSVAYLDGREVKVVGTWYNLDSENKIQKGSGLYVLLSKLNAKNLNEALNKEMETELDENEKYLCFKAY